MLHTYKATQEAAKAGHTNVMSAITTSVSRSEIDTDNRALHGRVDELDNRISTTDKRLWGAVVGALGAFGSMVLTKVGLLH